jgi:hypothetical protein
MPAAGPITYVSQMLRNAIFVRMQDKAIGLNAQIQLVAPVFKIRPFRIDFSESSKNYFMGQFSLEEIQAVTPVTLDPLVLIWYLGGRHNDVGLVQKSAKFAGTIDVGVEYYCTWPRPSISLGETWADFLEEVTLQMLTNTDNIGQPWPPQAVCQENYTIQPGVPYLGGLGWTMNIRIMLQFGVRVIR